MKKRSGVGGFDERRGIERSIAERVERSATERIEIGLLQAQASETAIEQVAVTRQNVDLANETLSRSKDRFAAGVTDSVEVVQSEQSLASANDQYITALYNHNVAKLSLAHSLGVARTDYSQYLGGK